MEFFGNHRLVAHPYYPPAAVRAVEVEVRLSAGGGLRLTYAVEPAQTLLLPRDTRGREDGLWRSTCFELFLKGSGEDYREFNFAPSGAWNAYTFTGWRRGMEPMNVSSAPQVRDGGPADPTGARGRYLLEAEGGLFVRSGEAMSLTTVIEETDGTKSYWALAHGPGDADFHHPACFVLDVPPAPQSSSPA